MSRKIEMVEITAEEQNKGRRVKKKIEDNLREFWASLVAQLVKNPLQCGRPGFNPWVGKIPWRSSGYPLQYSGLENSMDCILQGVAKSQTQLSNFHFASETFGTILNMPASEL